MKNRIPTKINKACMLLGVRANDLTLASVLKAWELQLISENLSPEFNGENNEYALEINSAKDLLVNWLAENPHGGSTS